MFVGCCVVVCVSPAKSRIHFVSGTKWVLFKFNPLRPGTSGPRPQLDSLHFYSKQKWHNVYWCAFSRCLSSWKLVGCRELVGQFECKESGVWRKTFIHICKSHFGFVWVCDDGNAEALCRKPTSPVDKLFDFYEDTFGLTKLLHGFSFASQEMSAFTCLSIVVWTWACMWQFSVMQLFIVWCQSSYLVIVMVTGCGCVRVVCSLCICLSYLFINVAFLAEGMRPFHISGILGGV